MIIKKGEVYRGMFTGRPDRFLLVTKIELDEAGLGEIFFRAGKFKSRLYLLVFGTPNSDTGTGFMQRINDAEAELRKPKRRLVDEVEVRHR
jgi:hypothetical protein